jgi:hypothetical protein
MWGSWILFRVLDIVFMFTRQCACKRARLGVDCSRLPRADVRARQSRSLVYRICVQITMNTARAAAAFMLMFNIIQEK